MATNNNSNGTKGPGEGYMGPLGIALVVGYTLLFMAFVIYSLVSLWPPVRSKEVRERLLSEASVTATPSPAATATATPTPRQPGAAGNPGSTATPTPTPTTATATPTATPTTTPATVTAGTTPSPSPAVTEPDCEQAASIKEGFCLDEKGRPREGLGALKYMGYCRCIYDEDRLLMIVLLAGALGALVHGLRSLSWYTGQREAVWSWSAMYFMLPFLGAGLSAIFYFVIRGGFFSPTSSVNDTSPFGFAALSALIGMFTEPAVIKLRKVAITVLEPPEQGKDHAGPAPKITELSLKQGSVKGDDTVTITGQNFSNNVVVTFGGVEADVTSESPTSITVKTPPHAKGKVDVVIRNEDKQKVIVKEGFEYIEPPD